jgi:glucose/arabinose dehydrogenase
MGRLRAVLLGACVLALASCRGASGEAVAAPGPAPDGPCVPASGTSVALRVVATGLRKPVLLTSPPGDPRLFVVEQPGRVRILGAPGTAPTTFLDLRDAVQTGFSEQGLLGLAFHPDFATNGRFFVHYSNKARGETVLAEYRVSADRDRAETRERRIFELVQPFANHNGGHIAFGPDGLLYLGLGDGGAGGDPQGHGQNAATALGSMLRFDVSGERTPVPETVAIGVRNPWRWSFDRANGDLWIGDVGQGSFEEIDRIPAGVTGLNLGWNTMEGAHCYDRESCDREGLTLPVIEVPRAGICDSITGGYVYRGSCLPDLAGTYFYGDYCDNYVRTLRLVDGAASAQQDLTDALGARIDGLSSFGEDAAGELYVLSHRDGVIYKLVAR